MQTFIWYVCTSDADAANGSSSWRQWTCWLFGWFVSECGVADRLIESGRWLMTSMLAVLDLTRLDSTSSTRLDQLDVCVHPIADKEAFCLFFGVSPGVYVASRSNGRSFSARCSPVRLRHNLPHSFLLRSACRKAQMSVVDIVVDVLERRNLRYQEDGRRLVDHRLSSLSSSSCRLSVRLSVRPSFSFVLFFFLVATLLELLELLLL